eukprot:721288_1
MSMYKHWDSKFKKRKITSILTIISITLFAFCMIWCTVHVFSPFTKDPTCNKKVALYVAYLAFTIGRSSMFLLFLGIIHYTFRDTRYNYSTWIKIAYLLPSLIIPIILIIWTTYDRWFYYNFEAYKIRRYLDHANTIILCIFSTFLFCKVLARVAWRQIRTSSEGSDVDQLKRINKMLNTITKYTVLVLIIIFFAICVMIMDELTWNQITFNLELNQWFLILFILYYIDCFVNIFCVYLRFVFADPIYNNLCMCAHKCCLKCVQSCIKWKYNKYIKNKNITNDNNNGVQLNVTVNISKDTQLNTDGRTRNLSTPHESIPTATNTPNSTV